MITQRPTDLSKFFIAGINYKKADASVRGKFAINNDQYVRLFSEAIQFHVKEFFILSTCNRTEIYGFADEDTSLCRLLCAQTVGTVDGLLEMGYIKKGMDAIEHLFHVAAGLDSQILGDYEIVGQLKTAVKLSKEYGFINVFTERLVNTVLQSSKNIRTNTALSGGTVSVSFAAIQFIKEKIEDIPDKKILVLGAGKIGRNTCKNLVDYLNTKNIIIINRTDEKAQQLAVELGLGYAAPDQLPQNIAAADIIITATNATSPVILKSCLQGKGEKLIIDLSVPSNVEEAVQELSEVTLVNVDLLSKMKDETLANRMAEVPNAKAIIAEHLAEFIEWNLMRKNVPVLRAVKTKLKEIHTSPLFIPLCNQDCSIINTDKKIQRVINGMASKMKLQDQKGCQYIEAINEFIATGTNQ